MLGRPLGSLSCYSWARLSLKYHWYWLSQEGPAFGALIIGCGLAYFLHHSGKPFGLSLLIGVVIAVADYFILVWLKNRGVG